MIELTEKEALLVFGILLDETDVCVYGEDTDDLIEEVMIRLSEYYYGSKEAWDEASDEEDEEKNNELIADSNLICEKLYRELGIEL